VAYRNPAFLVRNRVADAGASAITSSTTATGQGKERLIDSRIAKLARFNASAANQFFEVDFGSAVSIDRMVIPVGHNLNGCSVELLADTTATPTTVRDSFTAGSGVIDRSFGPHSYRYWRIKFVTSGQWELGEWVLGDYQQTAEGIVQEWSAPRKSSVRVKEFPSREALLIEAAVRRRFEMTHQACSAADLAIYDEVLDRGVGRPFWFWSPDDSLTSPLFVRLEDDADREQDSPNPKGTGPTYTVSLAMREQGT
jgi:hypothetical protein